MAGEFLMQLDPPRPCYVEICSNLATIGLVTFTGPHNRHLEIEPRCHVHGYFDEIDGEALLSVERFVVHELGKGKGAALVIRRAQLEEVPAPYEISTPENSWILDEAFYVAYRDEQVTVQMVYVIWCPDDLALELYP